MFTTVREEDLIADSETRLYVDTADETSVGMVIQRGPIAFPFHLDRSSYGRFANEAAAAWLESMLDPDTSVTSDVIFDDDLPHMLNMRVFSWNPMRIECMVRLPAGNLSMGFTEDAVGDLVTDIAKIAKIAKIANHADELVQI